MNKLDFDNEQELESAFAEAARTFAPRPGLRESQRQRLFGRQARRLADEAQPPTGAHRRRRWFVWAVAASLVLAAFLIVNRPETRFVSVAYAEFAAALENADNAGWVHYFEGATEEWIAFEPYRHYSKWPDSIWAWDRSANREYRYDRAANTLTVRHLGRPGELEVLGSFTEFMRQKVAGLEQRGRRVRRGTGTFRGKPATVYEVTGYRPNEGGKYVKGKYFFDRQTGRVLGFEGSGTGWLSWLKYWIFVDHPVEGPKDVYALGVPRDAKIIDETPPSEVLELVQQVDEARARGPKQLYQISAEVYESFTPESAPPIGIWVEVTSTKDGRLRRDRFGVWRTTNYEQSLKDLASFRKEVLDSGINAVEAWLKERRPRQILFADTGSGETTFYRRSEEDALIRESIHSTLTAQALAQGWGQPPVAMDFALDRSSTLVTDRSGPWGELVGVENRKGRINTEAWYVNLNRDYICERHARGITEDNRDVTEVTEYDRTPGGYWYVKAARKSVHSGRDMIVIRNFRDDDRVIDPNLFDESRIAATDLSVD